ncbi:MAG: sugar ABC transporter substrate-binding protein [Treponema sp.]|nr:sugar ABC transporter substrate-binding protein [Treponema sp.]
MKEKFSKTTVYFFISLFIILILLHSFLMFLSKYPSAKSHVPRKFGATYMTMDNEYFEILNSAIEEIVESNGDILITRDPANSQTKQNLQIKDMLDEGVNLIFINPVDWYTIKPAIEECTKRNVPYIVVDTDVYDKDLAVSIIISDNYNAGVLIGKDLASKRDSSKIVILYDKGIDSTQQRLKGFLDTLAHLKYKYEIAYIASGTTLVSQTMVEMQKIIDLKLDFDIVFGGNDPAALGALAAIQKNHLDKDILVYGIDGSPTGKQMIAHSLMAGSSAQFPKIMGKKAAETAYEYLSGNPVEHRITIPVELITKENIADFDVLGWQ